MQSNTQNIAISKFDIVKAGKVVETCDTYTEAWAKASKIRGAMVVYKIPKRA